MVNYLIQWIRHHVTTMSERIFPNNPVELKVWVLTDIECDCVYYETVK